ncbi:MAG: hypothetical protein LQ337_007029 [Flavoplaca oasis]|nr:MAG: hypothetical protein LQ337_007029 [Flavoplaca oasis]
MKMWSLKLSVGLSILLGSCNFAASQDAINLFKRADALTSRSLERNTASAQSRNLVKRASSYLTDATQQFAVNGSGIPDVDFDVGESYAGLLPISSSPNETRQLFFWFFPSTNPEASNEVTIWSVTRTMAK